MASTAKKKGWQESSNASSNWDSSWASHHWSWTKDRDDDADQWGWQQRNWSKRPGDDDDAQHPGRGEHAGGNNREWPWMKKDNDGTATGPSSSESPYLVPVDLNPNTARLDTKVAFTSLLTVGDQVGFKDDGITPWRMAGIPDGLGAFDNGDGTFTVLMNHEIPAGRGVPRDHDFNGAFISELVIDKKTLKVIEAKDLIEEVHVFNPLTGGYVDATSPLSRLCSADLAEPSAFYNAKTGRGYEGGRIFLNGEETGPEGRAFAHFATGALAGNTYELAWLGNMSYENAVASPYTGDKTVVALLDDATPGQVYFYYGDKKTTGNALDKAGLTGGSFWGLQVAEFTPGAANNEPNTLKPLGADDKSAFNLVNLGDVSRDTGAQIQAESEALGVTEFLRPEDGQWDTINEDRFYFVTTNSFGNPSRLWAADFKDASNPTKGGTIKLLLDGSEGQQMLDNMTVDHRGHVILQEDVGNNPHNSKVWDYNPFSDTLTMIAEHDPNRFEPGGAEFAEYGQDEESSGVIDISHILGTPTQSVYLMDVQAHSHLPPRADAELVEGGQLLLMTMETRGHQDWGYFS